MVRARTETKASRSIKLLLDGREATLDLGGRVKWALVNEGGHGFLPRALRSRFAGRAGPQLGELEAVERFALVSDTWAATVAGLMPLKEFLAMRARCAARPTLTSGARCSRRSATST